MKFNREFIANLVAEVVARFVIGAVMGVFAMFAAGRFIARSWDELGWTALAVPALVGVAFALFGTRKGPGVI